jgi:hypothetical protein
VSFPNDEAVSGDNSQTVDELRPERKAEVVQPQFEVFLLLQGDVWVGRFRENFLHEYLTRCHDLGSPGMPVHDSTCDGFYCINPGVALTLSLREGQ